MGILTRKEAKKVWNLDFWKSKQPANSIPADAWDVIQKKLHSAIAVIILCNRMLPTMQCGNQEEDPDATDSNSN